MHGLKIVFKVTPQQSAAEHFTKIRKTRPETLYIDHSINNAGGTMHPIRHFNI
jgi:hypothetical protein